MSNQIAVSNTQAVIGNFTQNELDTIKNTIAKGSTNEQYALFVQTCVNSGLNPFLNHVYCILYGKDNPTMNIQVSVEGILYLARKKDGYKGVDAQIIHENDEFKFNATSKEIVHNIGFPRGQIIGGYAIAKRENFEDVVVLMEVSEVEVHKKGLNSKMWNGYFNDMFKKHLIKRAAKLQYGIEIGEDENVVTSSSLDEATSNYRKDITPNTQQIEISEGEIIDTEQEIKNRWEEIKDKQNKLNLSEDDLKNIIKVNFNTVAKSLNLQQLVGLSKLIDLEANKKTQLEPKVDFFDGITLDGEI